MRKSSKILNRNTVVSCLLIILLTTLFSGCDDRAAEKPKLTVSVDRTHLYANGADCNLNFTNMTFVLTGPSDFTQNAKILVDYEPLRGTFVHGPDGGAANFVHTGKDGVAKGIFVASETTYGIASITATVDRFRDVKKTKVLYLYQLPFISITLEDDIIEKNGSTIVAVKLTDPSENVANVADKSVSFSTSRGSFAYDTRNTNNNGIAQNVLNADGQTGTANITATFTICQNIKATKSVRFVETANEPQMSVEVEKDILYGQGADCNINYTDIYFTLTGEPQYTENIKINITYDKSKGTLIGDGSSDYVTTGSNSQAIGRYVANAQSIGTVTLTARHENFNNVFHSFDLHLFDIPEMEFTAESYNIGINDSTTVTVTLTDLANNVNNQRIDFTFTGGNLKYSSVFTDDDGVAKNVFYGQSQSGTAVIRAKLGICPNRYKEVRIDRN